MQLTNSFHRTEFLRRQLSHRQTRNIPSFTEPSHSLSSSNGACCMSQSNPFQILTPVFQCLDHSKDYPSVLMLFVPYNFEAERSPLISCTHPLIHYACSYPPYPNATSLGCKLKTCHVMVARWLLDIGKCHHFNIQLLLLPSSKLLVHYKLQNIFVTSGFI